MAANTQRLVAPLMDRAQFLVAAAVRMCTHEHAACLPTFNGSVAAAEEDGRLNGRRNHSHGSAIHQAMNQAGKLLHTHPPDGRTQKGKI